MRRNRTQFLYLFRDSNALFFMGSFFALGLMLGVSRGRTLERRDFEGRFPPPLPPPPQPLG